MRRFFQTRDGVSVSVVLLTVSSPYFGAVEITRIDTATKFLLDRAVERGELVIGVDLGAPPRQLPPEELVAELHSAWLPHPVDEPDEYRTERTLRCYQNDGDDPFATLAVLIGDLDWARVSRLKRWA